MTPHPGTPRRAALGAALALAALALAGCGGGLSSHAGTPFTACLREGGVDLSDMAAWTREREREELSDPRALACVLSDLPAGDRRDVLGWAFPDVPPEGPSDAQATVADAIGRFLDGHDALDARAISDAGGLLAALGMTGPEPEGVRHALALQLHRDSGGPLYDAWREGLNLEDDHAARARFVSEQLAIGGALAEFYAETSDALLAAQENAAPD